MKSTEIHNGLTDRQVRDFLAKEHRAVDALAFNGGIVSSDEKYIRHLKLKLEELQDQIAACEKAKAIEDLISSKGWGLHDVSDVVAFDENYMPFIGTEEEAEMLFTGACEG